MKPPHHCTSLLWLCAAILVSFVRSQTLNSVNYNEGGENQEALRSVQRPRQAQQQQQLQRSYYYSQQQEYPGPRERPTRPQRQEYPSQPQPQQRPYAWGPNQASGRSQDGPRTQPQLQQQQRPRPQPQPQPQPQLQQQQRPRPQPQLQQQQLHAQRQLQPPHPGPAKPNLPPPSGPFSQPRSATAFQKKAYCNPQDCKLPDCYCAGQAGPRGLAREDLPQMVSFSFDDAVNERVMDYYMYLLRPDRLNPNGCPISATFSVSDEWTNYTMVKELYLRGHELASHSITHRYPESWWYQASYSDWQFEIEGQRDRLSQKASIPKSEIRGVRAPFLALGGDQQFQMMQDFDFEYDSSFMTGPHKGGGAWPFTLDYSPSVTYCTNIGCPKLTFPGLWEVPMNRWVDLDGKQCVMVDVCNQRNEDETLEYLWQNFKRHYEGNRAPLAVNMHATWFNVSYKLEAMNKFILGLVAMDDVYIITTHQVLEWMRAPQPLANANRFPPWRTSCRGRENRQVVSGLGSRDDMGRWNPAERPFWSASPTAHQKELQPTEVEVRILREPSSKVERYPANILGQSKNLDSPTLEELSDHQPRTPSVVDPNRRVTPMKEIPRSADKGFRLKPAGNQKALKENPSTGVLRKAEKTGAYRDKINSVARVEAAEAKEAPASVVVKPELASSSKRSSPAVKENDSKTHDYGTDSSCPLVASALNLVVFSLILTVTI